MAKTVNAAFSEFMKNSVNLDANVVSNARNSRDNLLSNIAEFSGDDGFFNLYDGYNVHFGSFARKTKCRELDDIDLMIGLPANGATYNSSSSWDDVTIIANTKDEAQKKCANADGTLNSTSVLNMFKSKLEKVREYKRSELGRRGEAVVLNLKSKDWSFDIVPCFHTAPESDGREYYIIPNGKGRWKKTDPIKDRDRVTTVNQSKNGRLLELVRLCKKWNEVRNPDPIPSYLLETMIVNYAESVVELDLYIDFRFRGAIKYISDHITGAVYDMKEIQGDINTMPVLKIYTIKQRAVDDYEKACKARDYEKNNNHERAIMKWGEIFGSEFPKFG